MDIKEVRDTVLRWVHSCNRVEQLDRLQKSAPEIIYTLFDKTESELSIDLTVGQLLTAIDLQKEKIKKL